MDILLGINTGTEVSGLEALRNTHGTFFTQINSKFRDSYLLLPDSVHLCTKEQTRVTKERSKRKYPLQVLCLAYHLSIEF